MKKRLMCLLLSGFIALAGLFMIAPDTYAVPVENPETVIDAPDEVGDEDAEDTEAETEGEEAKTCYDQVGAIGWLVCPTTGFLSKMVDGVYGIIQSLLQVNPVSTDQDSPIYVVWEYVRNLTNIIFIIFLIVVIYAQLTGFGLNNYGIKRVLPRIIIAAVLVNLSFIICALAVDVSNVLGASLRGVFTNIQETAIANGSINEVANFSISEVVGAALGTAAVGTGAVVAGIAVAGGIGAALWMLLPIILAGVVAVIAALVTLAGRQALVLLLIMIAPLAFVAYLLPNTEGWFKKWKDLFLRMLVFYPMFSVLFGASQLAGWVIITAATNWFGVILGIAVQILPLFFAIPLMRMSGTMLGKVNDLVRRPFAPVQKGVGAWSDSHRQLSKQRYQAMSQMPGARFSRYLADRKLRREEDTGKYAATNKLRSQAFSAESVYRKDNALNRRLNRAGTLTGRGEKLYDLQGKDLESQRVVKQIATDFDEGYDTSARGADARIRGRGKQFDRLSASNALIVKEVDSGHIQDARAESVKLANMESYASRINDAVEANKRGERSEIYSEIVNSSGALGERGINNVIATAIAVKEKAKKEATDNYTTLFDATRYTVDIDKKLREALGTGNDDAVSAAMQVMIKRGDTDMVSDALADYTPTMLDDTPENYTMQKRISDSLLGVKQDAAQLAAYAKAVNIVRAKALARRDKIERARADGSYDPNNVEEFAEIAEFGTFQEFVEDRGVFKQVGLGLEKVLGDYSDNVVPTQDRTVFKYLRKSGKLGFRMKDYRSGLTSGRMEGERLQTATDAVVGFELKEINAGLNADQKAFAEDRIREFVEPMAAVQIAGFKSDTVNRFALALSDNGKDRMQGLERLCGMFDDNAKRDLVERAKRGNLDAMNRDIRNDMRNFIPGI